MLRALSVFTLLATLLPAQGAQGQNTAWVDTVYASFETGKTSETGFVASGALLEKQFGGPPISGDLGLPPGFTAGAIAFENGSTYAVPVVEGHFAGVRVTPRDVARIEADGRVSIALDGSNEGIPPSASIDALSVRGSEFLLSFGTHLTIEDQAIGRSDIVRWQPSEGFSVLHAAADISISDALNVVALDRTATQTMVVGFDVGGTAGGLSVMPGDAVEYFPVTGTWRVMHLSRRLAIACSPCDIVALALISSETTIFRSGLERYEEN